MCEEAARKAAIPAVLSGLDQQYSDYSLGVQGIRAALEGGTRPAGGEGPDGAPAAAPTAAAAPGAARQGGRLVRGYIRVGGRWRKCRKKLLRREW
jgi:hypothetical protein